MLKITRLQRLQKPHFDKGTPIQSRRIWAGRVAWQDFSREHFQMNWQSGKLGASLFRHKEGRRLLTSKGRNAVRYAHLFLELKAHIRKGGHSK